MARSIFLLLFTTLIAWLLVKTVQAQTTPTAQFAYVNPRPDAKLVSAYTTIGLRHGDLIDVDSLDDVTFTVEGTMSGVHEGEIVLGGDGRAVLFRPNTSFTSAETVSVTISSGLKLQNGSLLNGLNYSFTISPKELDQRTRTVIT